MPIEDIKTPKAPANWRPSADQQRRIESDPRLQRMSRDDLYSVFNKAPARSYSDDFKERAQQRTPQRGGGLLGNALNRVTNAMRGR